MDALKDLTRGVFGFVLLLTFFVTLTHFGDAVGVLLLAEPLESPLTVVLFVLAGWVGGYVSAGKSAQAKTSHREARKLEPLDFEKWHEKQHRSREARSKTAFWLGAVLFALLALGHTRDIYPDDFLPLIAAAWPGVFAGMAIYILAFALPFVAD